MITRAEPAASRSVARLKDAGFEPLVMPLFKVRDTLASIPEKHHDAFIFTSANAIRVLTARDWRCENVEATAYCVGKRTAEAARVLGFGNVISADGNAGELAQMILKNYSNHPINALYFAGRERSFDMQEAFAGSLVQLEMVEVYEIEAVVPEKAQINRMIEELNSGTVFLYSHKTAKHVCETLFGSVQFDKEHLLNALAISPKTAEAVLKYPWQDVYVADEASEQSMIEKAVKLSLA